MRLLLSKKQMDFLRSIGIEDREYTKDEIEDYVIDEVSAHLCSRGFTDNSTYDKTNEIGDMCESIIDALSEQIYT